MAEKNSSSRRLRRRAERKEGNQDAELSLLFGSKEQGLIQGT